jgi:hypothetical protein
MARGLVSANTISRSSESSSSFPSHEYIDVMPGIMLTHAASWRSTRPRASFFATSMLGTVHGWSTRQMHKETHTEIEKQSTNTKQTTHVVRTSDECSAAVRHLLGETQTA